MGYFSKVIFLGKCVGLLTYTGVLFGSPFEFPVEFEKSGYATETYSTEIQVDELLDVVFFPNDPNQVLLPSKKGGIYYVADLEEPELSLALDLTDSVSLESESGISDVALHPDYPIDNRIFVSYTGDYDTGTGIKRHNILSQFTVESTAGFIISRASQQVLIAQEDPHPEHNAGDIEFGNDGYMYVSLGDGGGINYWYNGQKIDSDFFSGILRIDVDNRPESIEPNPHRSIIGSYKVPADNPFIGFEPAGDLEISTEELRTEFFAIGLRNPWRISFDRATGDLYSVDVGASRIEEVNLIQAGGNYGWHLREGNLPHVGGTAVKPFTQPLFAYEHGAGKSAATGVAFYRGDSMPELKNSVVFCDFSGSIGYIKYDATGVLEQKFIAHDPGSVSLRIHPDGETILLADLFEGTIKRLRYFGPSQVTFPEKLSDLNFFEDLNSVSPVEDLLKYDINLPFWSDHAIKTRYFLPKDAGQIQVKDDGLLEFPAGSVWVKHFDFEMERGNPESRKKLETRIIVKSVDGIYGLTYIWNEEQTDALLADEEGETVELSVVDDGSSINQTWTFPSRNACIDCHTEAGGYALGFQPNQLNFPDNFTVGLGGEHFLSENLELPPAVETHIKNTTPLVKLDDERFSLETRVRSYFAANCSQCHSPTAPTRANWDARFNVPLHQMNLIDETGISNMALEFQPKLVVPGDISPLSSILLLRLQSSNQFRMPPLGSNVIDQEAVDLVEDWIQSEPLLAFEKYEDWREAVFPVDISDEATLPDMDPDQDSIPNFVEQLISSNPLEETGELNIEYVYSPQTQTIEFRYISHDGSDKTIMRTESLSSEGNWEVFTPEWWSAREILPGWHENKIIINVGNKDYFYSIK